MEKPAQCSMEIYMVMRECWNFYQNQRPTFHDLVEKLQQILENSCDEEYLDLELSSPDTPTSSLQSFDYENTTHEKSLLHVDNNNYGCDHDIRPDLGCYLSPRSVRVPSERGPTCLGVAYSSLVHNNQLVGE